MDFLSNTTAHELALYIENEVALYRQAQHIMLGLARKINNGEYDSDKALKAWAILAKAGAIRYHNDFGDKFTSWYHIFSVEDRSLAAQELAYGYDEELAEMAIELKG